MSKDSLLTGEWYDARMRKPWAGRLVLVRLEGGQYDVASWNGLHWCCQDGRPYRGEIRYFYIYERLVADGYGE